MKFGKLKARPGMTEAATLESLILHELSQIRDRAGKACVHNLSKYFMKFVFLNIYCFLDIILRCLWLFADRRALTSIFLK